MAWCRSREKRKKSKLIDKEIFVARRQRVYTLQLLLLGASNSGKTTIAKQIRSLHTKGLTEEELWEFKPIIINTALGTIKTLKQQAQENEKSIGKTIIAALQEEEGVITEEVADAMISLWNNTAIQQTLKQQMDHSALYTLEHLSRISASDYVPIEEDVLAIHVETKAMEETVVQVQGITYYLLDIPARPNMKKWGHCFENFKGVMFCVDVGAYDTKRDDGTNTLHHSLQLFNELRDATWVTRMDIILFFNKTDVFKDKITRIPLTVCFPEYTGEQSYAAASLYIRDRFIQLWDYHVNGYRRGIIYSHFTCATDIKNIEVVFNNVCETSTRVEYTCYM